MAAVEVEAEFAAQEETPRGQEEEERLLGQEQRLLGHKGDLHTEDEPGTMFHGGAEGCPVMRPDKKDFDDMFQDIERFCSGNTPQAVVLSEKLSNYAVKDVLEHRPAPDDNLRRGSFGDVHVFRDPVTRHNMAVKTINECQKFRRGEVEFPLHMRRLCGELSVRESFVEILGIIKPPPALHLIMTAVDADLSEVIETIWWRGMAYDGMLGMVQHITSQLLHALQFMHEKGIAHLDIKPANIGFIYDTKRAVLLDFGTARRVVDGAPCHDQDGMTLFYKAPELFKGVQNKKADIYAMACVVYFLVYGRHMWPDATMALLNVFEFLKDLTPDYMQHKIPMNLPRDLRDLLIKMCHPHVSCRLSAEEACKHQFFSRPPVTPTHISLADRCIPKKSAPASSISVHSCVPPLPVCLPDHEEEPGLGENRQREDEDAGLSLSSGDSEYSLSGDRVQAREDREQLSPRPPESPTAGGQFNLQMPDVDEEEDETPLMQVDGGKPEEEALTDLGPQTVPAVVEDVQLTQFVGGNTEAEKDPEMPSNVKTSGFVSMETMDSNQDHGDMVSSNVTSE